MLLKKVKEQFIAILRSSKKIFAGEGGGGERGGVIFNSWLEMCQTRGGLIK